MSILKSCTLARIVLALLPSNAHFPLLEAMLKKGWPKKPRAVNPTLETDATE